MSHFSCKVCGHSQGHRPFVAKEMMFGTREIFEYFECSNCGCLQILEPPKDAKQYYPERYYSFEKFEDTPGSLVGWLRRRLLNGAMTRYKLGWGSSVGSFLCRLRQAPYVPEWLRALPRPVPLHAPILDVGCGNGRDLLVLRDCGFRRLRGVDPFIEQSLSYRGEVRVEKGQLNEVHGKFALIMLNHVFEHLERPIEVLRQAAERLADKGQILLRVPLSDSIAARRYRENWVQLDAPRHLFLHTRKSIELAASRAGLSIIRVVYDSTDFQFWGSEQYLRGIPLYNGASGGVEPNRSIFSEEQLQSFAEEAKRLNSTNQGDQAAFVMVTE
jgi:SAM-dependent methyltransferase